MSKQQSNSSVNVVAAEFENIENIKMSKRKNKPLGGNNIATALRE